MDTLAKHHLSENVDDSLRVNGPEKKVIDGEVSQVPDGLLRVSCWLVPSFLNVLKHKIGNFWPAAVFGRQIQSQRDLAVNH